MSTTAVLGVVQRNGSVKAFDIWYDGYPEHVILCISRLLACPGESHTPVGARPLDELVRCGDLRNITGDLSTCEYHSYTNGQPYHQPSKVYQSINDFSKSFDDFPKRRGGSITMKYYYYVVHCSGIVDIYAHNETTGVFDVKTVDPKTIL